MTFRASDEEARELDALVALGGLSKQDYNAAAPLPRRRGGALLAGAEALEDTSREVLGELRRLDDAREVPLELREAMGVPARTLEGLGSPEAIPEATMADDAMASMERGD